MPITVKRKGNFSKTMSKFKKWLHLSMEADEIFTLYGEKGVQLLREYTPEDTGKTKDSWNYEILKDDKKTSLIFTNSNITSEGTPIAILLQYGHATKSGTWVEGQDYINPALKPLFQEILHDIETRMRSLK